MLCQHVQLNILPQEGNVGDSVLYALYSINTTRLITCIRLYRRVQRERDTQQPE